MSQCDSGTSQAHLTPEEMVSYIDQVLTDQVRRRAESHLAECPACLREVLEVRELLRKQV
jgi:anti-sigma factor RsiW